ncbi:hypothetical protein [Pseudarthrobacter siccitolerans]|uniref:hypothetical protein n=1 Tax=Pseudarthrobacter siccitolerans TaxID=861266 RepID=UPI0027BA5C75|nr:hypothetical protein [Pseudarthrobacter siccitolerans]
MRALLVPALIALAWLVWGADSAQASTDPSKAAVSESALDPSLVNAPSSPAAQLLPAGQDPASSTAQHVAGVGGAVVGATAPTVSIVTQVTEPVALPVTGIAAPAVSAVSQTATPVTATVNRTVASLASTLDRTVAAVDDAVASIPQPLPRLPLPAVIPPQLPNPNVPVATVPETKPAAVSTVLPSPAADARQFVPDRPSGEVNPVQNIDPPFKTFAQPKITASTGPLASAIQAPAPGQLHEHPVTDWLNNAATHGAPGSSGSGGSASHMAHIAAFWDGLSPAASAVATNAAVTPPSGPAADPGSSPD